MCFKLFTCNLHYNAIFFSGKKKYVAPEKIIEDAPGGLGNVEQTLQFYPNPLVSNFSPIVKDSSEVTLFDLDCDRFMFSSSLPPACKELYDDIKGLYLNSIFTSF